MQVKVLKPFPYAEDGINAEQLEEGATAEVRDDLVEGLKAEGFIEFAGDAPISRKVETSVEHGEAVAIEGDAYPQLTAAQEVALDRDNDGAPGGSPKGRRRKGGQG